MSDQKKSGERGLGADRVEEGYGATTPGSSKPAAQQRGALSQYNSPPQQRSSHPTQHSPQLYSYGQYPHAGQVGGSSQQPHVGSAPAYYHQQSHLAPQRQLPHSMYNPRSSSRQVTPDERQYLYSGYRSPIGSSLQRTLHSPADRNRSPTKRPRQSKATPSTIASSSPGAYSLGSLYRPSPSGSLQSGTPTSLGSARSDSALLALTKKFRHLLRCAPGNRLDLNRAVQEMRVQKRRIYDITNVLEGIGLITKDSKNLVSWNNEPQIGLSRAEEPTPVATDNPLTEVARQGQGSSSAQRIEQLRQESDSLLEEDQQLDRILDFLTEQSRQFSNERSAPDSARPPRHLTYLPQEVDDAEQLMHVRYSDITSLAIYDNDTIIVIKAPIGTNLEVPDPDQGMRPGMRRYQMYLNSTTVPPGQPIGGSGGPINVYLVRPQVLPGGTGGEPQWDEGRETGPSVAGAYVQGTPAPSSSVPGETLTEASRSRRKAPYSAHSEAHSSHSAYMPPYSEADWGPPPHPEYPNSPYYPMSTDDSKKRRIDAVSSDSPIRKKPNPSSKSLTHPPQEADVEGGKSPLSPKPRLTPDRARQGDSNEFLGGQYSIDFSPTPGGVQTTASWALSSPWGRSLSYHHQESSRSGHFGPPTPIASGTPGDRPPTPNSSQQDLYHMPLQSPTLRGFFHSGFLSSPSSNVHLGMSPMPGLIDPGVSNDAHFPLPSFHSESHRAGTISMRERRFPERSDSDPVEPPEVPRRSRRPPR